jgi:hypothetical protein
MNKAWIQARPWVSGLFWGWFMFLILTGIDYHNGDLPVSEIPVRFAIWTVGGILYGYLRVFLFRQFVHRRDAVE